MRRREDAKTRRNQRLSTTKAEKQSRRSFIYIHQRAMDDDMVSRGETKKNFSRAEGMINGMRERVGKGKTIGFRRIGGNL